MTKIMMRMMMVKMLSGREHPSQQLRMVVGVGRHEGGAESWRTNAITSGRPRCLAVDEGDHMCLPADSVIADVPVVDFSLVD